MKENVFSRQQKKHFLTGRQNNHVMFIPQVALELYKKTQQIESEGGMMIKNGTRRRTPGGLYLQLLRDVSHEDPRVDAITVGKKINNPAHSFFFFILAASSFSR